MEGIQNSLEQWLQRRRRKAIAAPRDTVPPSRGKLIPVAESE